MEQTLLQQGLQLMLFGMGTVFIFLVVLIACTTLMSRAVLRFAPADFPPVVTSNATAQGGSAQKADRTRLIAAITAALHQHRARRDK